MPLIQQAAQIFEKVFGGDVPVQPLALGQVVARAVLVYIMGVVVIRVGKSRMIGRFTSLDVIVGIVLGSLLSRGITGDASLTGTFAASGALVAAHWACTWIACHSHFFGALVKGHAILLVKNGRMLRRRMHASHISVRDLEAAMRKHGIESVAEVRKAYKERNGEVTFIKAKEPQRLKSQTIAGAATSDPA